MKEILTWFKQNLPGAKIWHVRGRFRDFASERETYSFNDFYVITQKDVEFIWFSAKSKVSGYVTFSGVSLSRYTSMVESQLAKKILPSHDWKVLVMALPKEKNQRLLIFRRLQDNASGITEIIDLARELHQKFLAGVKKLVSDLAQNL